MTSRGTKKKKKSTGLDGSAHAYGNPKVLTSGGSIQKLVQDLGVDTDTRTDHSEQNFYRLNVRRHDGTPVQVFRSSNLDNVPSVRCPKGRQKHQKRTLGALSFLILFLNDV